MKNLIIIIVIVASSASLFSFAKIENKSVNSDANKDISFNIPDNVQEIIDNSCYTCHNNDSRTLKSKMKLNFDDLPGLKVSKQISKLMNISKVVKKGKMPLQKYIDKYPDKKLTNDQAVILSSWALNTAEKLAGE